MKGECKGGPLHGQTREADGLFLVTPQFVPNEMPWGSPPPSIAGHVYEYVYDWVRIGVGRGEWVYRGLR